MSLILELPRGRPPAGMAAPVRGGPYANPALLWSAATPFVNLANGETATQYGTGTSRIAGPFGAEVDFTGVGTGKLTFATPPERDEVTIAITARVGSTTNLDRIVSACNGSSNGVYDFYADGTPLWVFQAFRSTTSAQYRATALPAAFNGTLVVSWVVGQTPIVYYNGASQTLSTISAGSGSIVASSNLLSIGGRPDLTTRQVDAGISMVCRIDRALPRAAVEKLSMPGMMSRLLFEPRRIIVPVPPAATGLPTLSSLTTSNITATTARLGLTLTF